MFDVGFLEVLVIGIVALIVIGPEKLPAVARTVGTWVGKMQRFVRGVKSDFASELKSGDLKKIIGDQNDQISELRNLVTNARQELKAGVDEVTSSTRTNMDDFKKMVDEGKSEANSSVQPAAKVSERANDDASAQTPTKLSDEAADETPAAQSPQQVAANPTSVDSTKQSD